MKLAKAPNKKWLIDLVFISTQLDVYLNSRERLVLYSQDMITLNRGLRRFQSKRDKP